MWQVLQRARKWFGKNKKRIWIGGSVALVIVSASVGYVLFNNQKISFSDWLKMVSKDELDEAYEKLRLNFVKTGCKTYEMEQIGHELGLRGAREWFEKHPPNTDVNFRWTDANRWDRD